MINVLDSIKQTIGDLEHVSIDDTAVKHFTDSIVKDDLAISEIALAKYEWDLDSLIELVFTFNTINFCFWAEKDKSK